MTEKLPISQRKASRARAHARDPAPKVKKRQEIRAVEDLDPEQGENWGIRVAERYPSPGVYHLRAFVAWAVGFFTLVILLYAPAALGHVAVEQHQQMIDEWPVKFIFGMTIAMVGIFATNVFKHLQVIFSPDS